MGLELSFREIDLAALWSTVWGGEEEGASTLGEDCDYPDGEQEPWLEKECEVLVWGVADVKQTVSFLLSDVWQGQWQWHRSQEERGLPCGEGLAVGESNVGSA